MIDSKNTTFSAGYIAYATDDKKKRYVLLTRNRNGFWDVPKGILEEDESIMSAAIREFREETGLSLSIIGTSQHNNSAYKSLKKQNVIDAISQRGKQNGHHETYVVEVMHGVFAYTYISRARRNRCVVLLQTHLKPDVCRRHLKTNKYNTSLFNTNFDRKEVVTLEFVPLENVVSRFSHIEDHNAMKVAMKKMM